MQRTQIYLPEDLRREIDRDRAQSGESRAEYLRKAASERIVRRRKSKIDLTKLAKEFTSGVKKSGWDGMTKEDIINWQREIRKDRKIF
ncbi:ribbon-helix-helix protein, CopG family [Candidatus Daviesbacteria bacterium]|nr:ribbon-helix-helix protein, CopG family [Candidatus Daviesbacteria bacterium]